MPITHALFWILSLSGYLLFYVSTTDFIMHYPDFQQNWSPRYFCTWVLSEEYNFISLQVSFHVHSITKRPPAPLSFSISKQWNAQKWSCPAVKGPGQRFPFLPLAVSEGPCLNFKMFTDLLMTCLFLSPPHFMGHFSITKQRVHCSIVTGTGASSDKKATFSECPLWLVNWVSAVHSSFLVRFFFSRAISSRVGCFNPHCWRFIF